MKKTISIVLLLMVLCLLPLDALAIRYGDVVYISNSNAVNVRRGPGTGYGVMGEVQPTNQYVYLGEEDGWYAILYHGERGYISASRGTIQTGLVPDEYGWGDYVEAIVRVTHGNALNVRSGPGTRYSSIGQAPSGSTWDYAGMEDGWNMIWYGEGQIGYIAANRTEVEVWRETEATSGATEEEDTSSGSNWEGAWPIFRHECEWCDGMGTNKWGNKCAFCDGNGWK